ncbi:hypothetical protein YC2023_011541 [Brassica napus]
MVFLECDESAIKIFTIPCLQWFVRLGLIDPSPYLILSSLIGRIFKWQSNPDTPEGTRLAPKYTSAEDILEGRLFHSILIDGGQQDSNPGPYWGQSSLKTTGLLLDINIDFEVYSHFVCLFWCQI